MTTTTQATSQAIHLSRSQEVAFDRDPWADYQTMRAPFSGDANMQRMERGLQAHYSRRNIDAPTVRVLSAEQGVVTFTLRWSLGD